MILAGAAGDPGGGRTVTFTLVALLVCVIAGITAWARAHTDDAVGFYAGGRRFSAPQNGLALAGASVSAASFLGVGGIVVLSGYDGFLYAAGLLAAWPPALLVAERMRNLGRFTMADVLAARTAHRPPVRIAAAVSTVTVSVCALVAQMVGAGALAGLLFGGRPGARGHGMPLGTAETLTIVVAGALVICCVMFGGMKGTTWVQIIKVTLLIAVVAAMTPLVLARFGFDPARLPGAAARPAGGGHAFLEPGMRYGRAIAGHPARTLDGKLDTLSLALALVLGTAGLPNVLARFLTAPNARTARRSVNWAIGLVGVFCLMTLVLGFGAAALVGRARILAHDPAGNTAVPQLAGELGRHVAGSAGGDVMLAVAAAVALAAIVAVAAGLVLAAATSLAHDCFGHVLMLGRPRERQEIAVARFCALLIGAVAVPLAVAARGLNVAFLVALVFAMAASANLPAIMCALFWRRFNGTGAVAGIYGGLVTAVVLVVFSPVVSGRVDPATGRSLSLFPRGIDFHWFPLDNPGLVAIPAGFLCAVAGTLLSREHAGGERFARLTVRALTGAGAVRPGAAVAAPASLSRAGSPGRGG